MAAQNSVCIGGSEIRVLGSKELMVRVCAGGAGGEGGSAGGGNDDGKFVSLYTYLESGTGCRTAAIAAALPITSGPVNCETALSSCRTNPVCLFYTIATVFQSYPGGDMMYVVRRRKLEPTFFIDSMDL